MYCSDFVQSFAEGLSSEEQFLQLALNKGFEAKESNKFENTKKHIDVFIRKNQQIYSVDVKAPKKPSRHSSVSNLDLTWVEIENVKGDVGWLYGEQDLIAFDFVDRFILVKREELMNYVESILITKNEVTRKISESDYSLYQRNGRKDIISRIESSDLMMLDHKVWYKN